MKVAVLLCFLAVAFAAPIALPNEFPVPLYINGEVIPGHYIVQLKPTVSLEIVNALATSVGARSVWNKMEGFRGFAGEFSEPILASLRMRSDIVEFIEADQVVRTFATQNNPPSWGLDAISSTNSRPVNNAYYYPDHGGAGATVYIIDTGIRCTHNTFGGRCSFGARYGNGGTGENSDGNGHGTHCGGTATGSQYGVAKSANVVAVGVLSPVGSGSFADVISGIEFSADDCDRSVCVGSLSLGGGASTSVDNAVNAAFNNGLFCAVAAGNDNSNAQNTSPARAAQAFTVMAYQSNGAKASYSNYGAVCEIWAPGTSITSSWHTSDTATNTISGTSMATPHVAGLAALHIASGRTTPTAVWNAILDDAQSGTVSGVPSGTTNAVAYTDANTF